MRQFFPFVLCGAFMITPAITGCDRTVSKESETIRSTDGDSKTTEKTVTQGADGQVKETVREKKVDN